MFLNSAQTDKTRTHMQIKGEMEAMERTKDEESKKLQSHNIHFDFSILLKIKESIVDVSSSCMELALKVYLTFAANLAKNEQLNNYLKKKVIEIWKFCRR